MRISEILNRNKVSISFEVFPPKTETAYESVRAATEEIAALAPAFISVTYGAGGGTSEHTIRIAENIMHRYGVPTLAHLTCVSSSHETVAAQIARIRAAGIENVMALRGDVPEDRRDEPRDHWDYHYAVDLIRELKAADAGFCIGGACYPEVHPESENQTEDIRYLKEKTEAGCDFLVTQMFFDNALFYDFLHKIRQAGIGVPVLPGIMPITNAKQVDRAITLSGSYVPPQLLRLTEKFADAPAAMKQAGIAYATEQIVDLFANGVKHVHVYSMNKPDVAGEILQNLSDLIGK